MQNNTTTNKNDDQKQAGKGPSEGNGKTPATASEPVGKPKSGKDLAVEDLAEYYANSKPPGRRYPPSMASNMLMSYVDGDMPDLPIIKDAGKKRESDEGEK